MSRTAENSQTEVTDVSPVYAAFCTMSGETAQTISKLATFLFEHAESEEEKKAEERAKLQSKLTSLGLPRDLETLATGLLGCALVYPESVMNEQSMFLEDLATDLTKMAEQATQNPTTTVVSESKDAISTALSMEEVGPKEEAEIEAAETKLMSTVGICFLHSKKTTPNESKSETAVAKDAEAAKSPLPMVSINGVLATSQSSDPGRLLSFPFRLLHLTRFRPSRHEFAPSSSPPPPTRFIEPTSAAKSAFHPSAESSSSSETTNVANSLLPTPRKSPSSKSI